MTSLSWKELALCYFVSTLLVTIGCSSSQPQGSNATAKRSIAGSVGNQGWYSTDQAAQGEALFKAKCSVCHGANLQGGAGPALAGNQFFLRYKGKPLSALWSTVHTEMPLNAPGTLTASQSLSLVAFMSAEERLPVRRVADRRALRYHAHRSGGGAGRGGRERSAVATAGPTIVKQPSTTAPSQAELENADAGAADWLTYGKGYHGARYSALKEITASKRIASAVRSARSHSRRKDRSKPVRSPIKASST